MAGPLDGVRVLDLTSVLFGPLATLVLGDMGADVVKVEPPRGDVVRYVGVTRHEGMSALFLNLNRNKRSTVIDLKRAEGIDVVLRLARSCDVFVHSMRPQTIERLGLDYESIVGVSPSIVYCNAWGFRRNGPYGELAAYDDVIQAATGVAAIQGRVAGEPQYVAGAIADKTAGLVAVSAIVAALYAREKTGRGQELEVPMFETMASQVLLEHLGGETFMPARGPTLYERSTSSVRRPYPTSDGHVSVLIYTDEQWRRFFELTGHAKLMDDDRFATVAARTANIDDLYRKLAEILLTRTTADWLERFRELSIPASRVSTVEDMLEDEQLREAGLLGTIEHPSEGRLRNIGPPVTFSATASESVRPAPRLGEHTSEVLRQAGYDAAEICDLVAAEVIVDGADRHQR
jgi:crotonobetainyl-CoA:carnitine CoA-transferase CaiB-like acyl-CoA transferase